MDRSKNIKSFKFYVKALYRECREIAKNLSKHLSSNQKCLLLQNHFQLGNSYAFSEAILHENQTSCKFIYLYNSFVYSMSNHPVCCIGCAMILPAGKQRSFGLLITRDKRIAITFQENHILNLGNQCHEHAT